MDIYNEDLINIIKKFQYFEVDYILVGGFATNFHGYKRATGDINKSADLIKIELLHSSNRRH